MKIILMLRLSIPIFLISLLSFILNVDAAVFSADSSGRDKAVFYSNETIYAYANESVATGSMSVRIYVVSNSDSWGNGTILTPVIPYIAVNTNSSGHIPVTTAWSPDTTAGDYDLVVDANSDGIYNQSIDFVDNETSLGFKILAVPKPTLVFSIGERSPKDHNWDYGNASESVIIQIKLAAGEQDIILSSIDLVAGGSGDDQKGISVIKVYSDSNGNGDVDRLDTLIAFGKFPIDNGVYVASIEDDYTIKNSTTAYILVTYSMGSVLNGGSFNFQIVSASASSISKTKAIISGLPLNSSTKTIVGGPEIPSKNESQSRETCTNFVNQSSCADANCEWCKVDSSCRASGETCPTSCTGAVGLSVEWNKDISIASVSGLANCDNKTVFIKEGSCNGETIASCNVVGSGCSVDFPTVEGEYNYYACIDVDENDIFESSDQTSQLISIQKQTQQQVEAEREPREFNYLYLLIPIVPGIIFLFVVIYSIRRRKQSELSNEYEELKEKWKRKKRYAY